MSIEIPQMFSSQMHRPNGPLGGTTTSSPWRVAEIVGAFGTLRDALAEPRVIITWLEANTASLVGPGAAAALSEFLQAHEKDKDVNEFLKAALAWRISQDLGTQHNTQAALHAWQENLKLIEERRQLHHSPGSSPTRDVVVTPTAV